MDALPGSAAAKAGLSTNDVIESINNIATRDMPLAFAEILLQGEPGSSIEMSVLTPRQADPQKMTLVRAPLVYPPVSGKLVTDQGPDPVGLITASTLQAGRAKDIAQKITDLEKQGAKRLMLDLRYCALGPDDEGIAVANLFMDKGLITYTQGQKSARQDHTGRSLQGDHQAAAGGAGESRDGGSGGSRRGRAAGFQARRRWSANRPTETPPFAKPSPWMTAAP